MWQLVDSWCPKGIRSAWGRSLKCLGLIAGVSVRRLTPSPYYLFCHSSQFSSRSRAFGKGKETAATQAILDRVSVDMRSSIGRYIGRVSTDVSTDTPIGRYTWWLTETSPILCRYFIDIAPMPHRYFTFTECIGWYRSIYRLIHWSPLDRHSTGQ